MHIPETCQACPGYQQLSAAGDINVLREVVLKKAVYGTDELASVMEALAQNERLKKIRNTLVQKAGKRMPCPDCRLQSVVGDFMLSPYEAEEIQIR